MKSSSGLIWGGEGIQILESGSFEQFDGLNPEISSFLMQNGIPFEIDLPRLWKMPILNPY